MELFLWMAHSGTVSSMAMKVACEQSSGEAGKKFGERSERTSAKLKNSGSSEARSQVTVKANVVLTVTKDNKIKRSKQNQNFY